MEGNRESGVLAGSHPDDLSTGLDAEELVALGVWNTGLDRCASSGFSDIDFAGLGGRTACVGGSAQIFRLWFVTGFFALGLGHGAAKQKDRRCYSHSAEAQISHHRGYLSGVLWVQLCSAQKNETTFPYSNRPAI